MTDVASSYQGPGGAAVSSVTALVTVMGWMSAGSQSCQFRELEDGQGLGTPVTPFLHGLTHGLTPGHGAPPGTTLQGDQQSPHSKCLGFSGAELSPHQRILGTRFVSEGIINWCQCDIRKLLIMAES